MPSLFGLAFLGSRTLPLTFTVAPGGFSFLVLFWKVWLPFLIRGPVPTELFDYVAEMSRPEGEREALTPASG